VTAATTVITTVDRPRWAPRPLPPNDPQGRFARAAFVVFALLMLFTIGRLAIGCAGHEALVVSAKAGRAEHVKLAARYEREQQECLLLSTAAFAEVCIEDVRKAYAPEWAAYRVFYLSWLAAHAAEYADDAEALEAAQDAAEAALEAVTHAR